MFWTKIQIETQTSNARIQKKYCQNKQKCKEEIVTTKKLCKDETWSLLPQNANMPQKTQSDGRNPKP